MLKKFKTLCISALLLLCCVNADGQVTRVADAERTASAANAPRGVMLSPEMMPKVKQNKADQKQGTLAGLSANKKTPRRATALSSAKLTAKGSAKITDLQGLCTFTGTTAYSVGWYSIPSSLTPSVIWERSSDLKITPRTGFVRNDEIFAFYTMTTTGSGLTDAGYYVLDLATGKVKENVSAAIFDTLEEVVVAATYDKEGDMAYVITYNTNGSSFILQQFEPKSRKFTKLGVTAPSTWLELGWNPADKSLYLFDESAALNKYDSKGKRFTQVNTMGMEIEGYTQSMVYSPKDNAFILPVDLYDETEDKEYTGMFLLPVAGSYTYLGDLPNAPQYGILYTTDEYINADGPKAPVLKSWNVTGSSTEGSFTVTLPSQYENGSAISGKVYVRVNIDNTDLSGSYNGAAGSDVTIPVSLTDGLHRFIVTPYTLGDDGKINGTPLVFDRALGPDVPKEPTNVKLTKTSVTWNAVTEGANGGSLNAAAVTYNVYVDKVLMNDSPVTGTSLAITLPTGKVSHTAEVYALCDGKTSSPGISNKLYEDGALSLPVFLGPENGNKDMDDDVIAMFTPVKDIQNTESLRGWRYDDQNEQTGGFYCLAPNASSTGTSNEWLFLPAINFADKDAHYKLTMEVWSGNHFFTSDETFEIALCQRPSPTRPTIIREATTIYKNPYFETSETLFQVPAEGEWYIGIHYISPIGSYRLYARNFKVEVAQSSADSPAAVTGLTATAAARGELTAKLSFTMPTVSISGTALDATNIITATATSKAGTASVTGKPGEKMTLDVPAIQGDNTIGVTTSSDKGEGMIAEVNVYCGIYRPATPIVSTSVSDDNNTISFEFELDDYNENGEFTGPDKTDIIIYRQVNGEWRVAANIGKSRTWTFTCPDTSKQDMFSFGVASQNSVGYCEEMHTLSAHLGKLYNLPMNEAFTLDGNNVKYNYDPLTIEHISYLQSTWGVTDPRELDETASNTSGSALCAVYDGESQLVLPRFTTKGLSNVKLDMSLFFGNNSPELVTVYATTPSIDMEPVTTITPESGNGWEHKLISLPALCQNQSWVQLIVRVKIVGYSQIFMMDTYSVKEYPADMMTISSFDGPGRSAVGKTLTYNVEIENAGSAEAALPSYTFSAIGANGVIAHSLANEVPATLAAGKKATLSFTITPKAADKGNANISFNLNGQPNEATSKVEKNLTILNAPIPVVTDLAYTVEGNDVSLTWSKPVFVENFEACEPWDMSEEIAGFTNLDLDGGKEWGIGEVTFPGKGAAKGFQVFSNTITDNPLFKAHSGEHYLICISASKVASDDWLISPEVVGGSEMSFWMNNMSSDYPETVLVMYSTTGNKPADFTKMLADGYVCPDETGWNEYSFTLPADAKYFALHHVAEDPEAAFGFMIDDIAYEAAKPTATLDGYNVYRESDAVANEIGETGYTDKDVDLSEPVRYYVMTVGTVNGEKVEGNRSNVVWVESTGVEDITLNGDKTIRGTEGAIVLEGFAAGEKFAVCNISGATVATGTVENDVTTVGMNAGIYIVKCSKTAAKVVVR